MKKCVMLVVVLSGLFLLVNAPGKSKKKGAVDRPVVCTLTRSFLYCDYGKNEVFIVDQEGKREWQISATRPQDVWSLKDGSILFSHADGATIVNRDKKVLWQYKTENSKNEIHSCQPLPDGVVMVAESGPMRILEIDTEGKIVREVPLKSGQKSPHKQMRIARKTEKGTYIVCQYYDGLIREYDQKGEIIREIKHPHAFCAITLPNGNLLCGMGDSHRVVEFDPEGKVVWEIKENELTGHPLRLAAGLQRLANGNTLICNWGGHGHKGGQPQVLEVTPDKKVTGYLDNWKDFGAINGVYDLQEEGDPSQHQILR